MSVRVSRDMYAPRPAFQNRGGPLLKRAFLADGGDATNAPVRTWKEVTEEFNRRNPGMSMSRGNVYLVHRSAVRKITEQLAECPLVAEVIA